MVFDLNGILCRCIEKRSIKGKYKEVSDHVYSHIIPTAIGPKGVYARPGVRKFLADVSEYVNIVVWTSMLEGTGRLVCEWLFYGIKPPVCILGQKACGKIPIADKTFLKYPDNNTGKIIFLKTLKTALFENYDGRFTVENTLLVDDSPEKSVLNVSGNALFLPAWDKDQMEDSFLLAILEPWLKNVSVGCKVGELREYVDTHRIGVAPLSQESALYLHIQAGMTKSEEYTGVPFTFPT